MRERLRVYPLHPFNLCSGSVCCKSPEFINFQRVGGFLASVRRFFRLHERLRRKDCRFEFETEVPAVLRALFSGRQWIQK